jgi:hypothetical protein
MAYGNKIVDGMIVFEVGGAILRRKKALLRMTTDLGAPRVRGEF